MMALDPTRFGMQPHKFGGLVTPPLKLRAFSFLSDERTHPDIRNGVVDVAVVRKRQGGDIGGGGASGGGGAVGSGGWWRRWRWLWVLEVPFEPRGIRSVALVELLCCTSARWQDKAPC